MPTDLDFEPTVPEDAELKHLAITFREAIQKTEARKNLIPQIEILGAIDALVLFINEHCHSNSGYALRRFLWSMWNQHHSINLFQFSGEVGGDIAESLLLLFNAWLRRAVPESLLRDLLTRSGEFDRWEEARARTPDTDQVTYPN